MAFGCHLDKPIIQNLEIFQILLNKVNTNRCPVDLHLLCHILHSCNVIQSVKMAIEKHRGFLIWICTVFIKGFYLAGQGLNKPVTCMCYQIASLT